MFKRLFKKNKVKPSKEQRFFKELELMRMNLDILDIRKRG